MAIPRSAAIVNNNRGMGKDGIILELRALSKSYAVPVLKEVSLSLKEGESLALVGANGAGKSTLIKILLGLVKATQGSALIFGHDVSSAASRQSVGYLPEKSAFWPELSAVEILSFFAELRGLRGEAKERRIAMLLSALGLANRGTRAMGTYSKGMLQRVGIALALLHDPDLIILDEPMSGLDPRAQEKLRSILLNLKKRGKTLLISSHSLDDIRLLCDRVIVLERGQVVADGPTSSVLQDLTERYRSSEPWDEDPLGEWQDGL